MRWFDPIEKANSIVPIETVLEIAGVKVEPGTTSKVHCPFGEIFHSDSGLAPTIRIYTETNTIQCFRCNSSYTPVWLAAQFWGIKSKNAAWKLLEHVGFKQPTLDEMWSSCEESKTLVPDVSELAVALQIFCNRVCVNWNRRQFEKNVSVMLNRCLILLDKVKNDTDANLWLEASKKAMLLSLEENQ